MGFLDELLHVLRTWWLGESALEITRVLASAVVMYAAALWIVRSGKKRFLGHNTVFDALLAFILGSVLSRAINGDAPLLSTILAGFVLMLMHWAFSVVTVRSHRAGIALKGGYDQVVKNGIMDEQKMKVHLITRRDLEMAAHKAGVPTVDGILHAYFERDGAISVVPKLEPFVVGVDVKDGVQRVVIEIRV